MRLEIPQHPWLMSSPLIELLDCLNTYGEARLVGGCVRDALLNRPVKDQDIATTLTPQEVKKVVVKHGFEVAYRRDDHGSVLVVAKGQAFDVTTLRKDIKTDGRHAMVTYTKDWEEDAKRRDFTINALYLDQTGAVYDPLKQGLEDLKNQKLRFIGNAQNRVQEDYLRLLRYFRFAVQLDFEIEEEILRDLNPYVQNLKQLSIERLWQELEKIFSAPTPLAVVEKMQTIGVFETLFSAPGDLEGFASYLKREEIAHTIARLVAFCPMMRSLVLKKKDQKLLDYLLERKSQETVFYVREIYEQGEESAQLVAQLRDEVSLYISQKERMAGGEFPVKAHDLEEVGPELGRALKIMEAWWLEQYCVPSKQACLDYYEVYKKSSK